MNPNLAKLFSKLAKKPELLNLYSDQNTIEEIYSTSEQISKGYTLKELQDVLSKPQNVIQEEELENVAGGVSLMKTLPLVASMAIITTGTALEILKTSNKIKTNLENHSVKISENDKKKSSFQTKSSSESSPTYQTSKKNHETIDMS